MSVEPKLRELERPDAQKRCQMYFGLFEEVLGAYPSIPDTMFIMDIGDMPTPSQDIPIFQFQKPTGSSAILLPDIDFIGLDYYHQPVVADNIPYQEKATSAIFVGGTSGQRNTVETVRAPVAPRLRIAKHFRGHPDIHVLLTTLTACENAEAEQALRDLGFGGPPIPWNEQFPHKFIISIDGNGATCSRVVIALKSNSALLKYNSTHRLYYFKGLIPWLHYVPIVENSDIEGIIRIEREYPDIFASIADEGRHFAETYINKQRVFQYVAELLTHYAVHVYPMNDPEHSSTTKLAEGTASQPQLSPRTLDDIGLETGTDKSSLHHGYLAHYEQALRDLPKIDRILEIGVHRGASLRMWREFLPYAEIVGLDVKDTGVIRADERIVVEIGNQADPAVLRRLVGARGPFDVVVDDGSHIWTHQIVSFETLFPTLVPGGLYILEDVHTSYGELAVAHGRDSPVSTAAYLHRLTDMLFGWDYEDSVDDLGKRVRPFAAMIDSIVVIRRSVLIRRRL